MSHHDHNHGEERKSISVVRIDHWDDEHETEENARDDFTRRLEEAVNTAASQNYMMAGSVSVYDHDATFLFFHDMSAPFGMCGPVEECCDGMEPDCCVDEAHTHPDRNYDDPLGA